MISLSFHGAAQTVTGSKYLLEVNQKKLLIDCGLFQGRKELRQRNWAPPKFDPRELEAIVVTHAHLDHIGYLPAMVKYGYSGKIYATAPTIELAHITLLDTAHIQEEDAEYRNRKKATSHAPALPLYTVDDAKQVLNLFTPINFNEWFHIGDEFRLRYHQVGHLLGAGCLEIQMTDSDRKSSILFSGDVGRYALPFVNDPVPPPRADTLICESTYGGEVHEPQDIYFEFAKVVDEVVKRKSILLIPAFALGRTQQITYIANILMKQKRIPRLDIHIDSPMAVKATDVYKKFPSFHQINRELLENTDDGFYGKNVHLHRKRKSSKELNKLKGPAIIMSASGMMTGGRILHHLINRLPDPNTILLLAGYMAEGTLGRRLLNGDKMVYIHKQPIEVKAEVRTLFGLSGHADSYELLHWLEPFAPAPSTAYITHGEPERSHALAKQFSEARGWKTHVPFLDETVEL